MKTKILLLIVAISACALNGYSQSAESGGSIVVPPSPNAASLINQSNEKVQLYTGSLAVHIPLFELKSRELSVPVSLNYNGSGNKVNDIGSWVGLSWSLGGAGGVITRVMRGIPDEFVGTMPLPSLANGLSNQPPTQMTAKGFLHPDIKDGTGLDLFDYFFAPGTTDAKRANLIDFSNKTGTYYSGTLPQVWDTEPDEFHFNFGEYSGKFVFDKAGTIKIIPHQNLTISRVTSSATVLGANSPRITSFEVTDAKGIKYTFGNTSVTNAASLTAVETTTYSSFNQYIMCGFIHSWENSGAHFWGTRPYIIFENQTPSVVSEFLENFQTFTSTWHLTRIQSPNNTDWVNFNYSSDGDVKFIVSQNQDFDQENYDYLPPDQGGPHLATIKDPYAGWDENGYITGIHGLQQAPRHQRQNITLSTTYNTIQAKRLSSIMTATGNSVNFIATNDRVDVYGGKELSDIVVKDFQGLEVKKFHLDFVYTGLDIINPDLHVFCFPMVNGDWFSVGESDFGPQKWNDDWIQMSGRDHFRTFLSSVKEVSGNDQIELYGMDYNFDEILPRRMSYKQDLFGYYNSNSVGHLLPVKHYTDTRGQASPFYFSMKQPGDLALADGIFQSSEDRDPTFSGANRSTNLAKMQAGILKSIRYATGGKKEFFYGMNVVTSGSQNYNAGGLVVKEIRSYPDANGSYFESTLYNYKLGSYALNMNEQQFIFQRRNYNVYSRGTVLLSSSSMVSPQFTKGSFVGYGLVEEVRTGNGKTVYEFVNPTEVVNTKEGTYSFNKTPCDYPSCLGFPFSPWNDFDHKRGNLKTVSNFDEAGRLLNKTSHTYSFNPQGFQPVSIHGIKPGRWILDVTVAEYFAGFYKYTNDWVVLTQTVNEIYDQTDPGNQSRKMVDTTYYSYIPVHPSGQTTYASDLLPRKITHVLANGEKVISETKYPRDYAATSSGTDAPAKGIYQLQLNKMESVPIESINYLEKKEGTVTTKYLLAGSLSKFKEFVANSGKVFLSETYKLKPGNTFTSYPWSTVNGSNVFTFNTSGFKLTNVFNNYDANGNLLSGTAEDGVQIDYTWGYNALWLTSLTPNPGAYQHQTVYTHAPLVGITQVTDPNARNSNFTYDGFERLKLVKDHDNNILNRYRYNYKNDTEGVASFVYVINPDNSVTLTSTGSHAAGSVFTWDFGNGTVKESSATYETVTYSTAGQYTVTLTVGHPEYSPATATATITILPAFSVAITAPTPTNGANRTVTCGTNAVTTCQATATGGPYTYKWEYNYSASGTSAWYSTGSNSPTLNFSLVGANATANSIRCKITDQYGNYRYSSNNLTIFYSCGSGPGPGDCQSGWTWNAQLGRCEPPPGYCGEGCVWSGLECVCQ